MQLVILKDAVAGYATLWLPVANTDDLDQIKIGDRFRAKGFGEGAEVLNVEAIDPSIIPGASRIFFNRGFGGTAVETHRLGQVFIRLNETSDKHVVLAAGDPPVTVRNGDTVTFPPYTMSISREDAEDMGLASVTPASEQTERVLEANPLTAKRGRGRPPGSRNKPRQPLGLPTWPGVS